MKRLMTIFFVLILLVNIFTFFACRDRSIGQPAAEPTDTPTPTRTFTPAPTNTSVPISGMIDDFSDCDGVNVFSGPWFSYGASGNTFTDPPITITPGYAGGSDCAIKIEGQTSASCDYGVCLSNALLAGQVADLSGNTGISFYAKGNGTYKVLIISPAITDYNNYQYTFNISSSWQQFNIPFSSFTQSWAPQVPVPISDVLKRTTHIAFGQTTCGVTFELVVDELQTY